MSLKQQIKIALVMDDYKVKNKDDFWRAALKKRPEIERDYEFVSEEMGPGITKDTSISYRTYKLKAKT